MSNFVQDMTQELNRLDDAERERMRWRAQEEARTALAAIVAAVGGEVRVPDSLLTESFDLIVSSDPLNNVTIYRALPPLSERGMAQHNADPAEPK
jgi:hypothetical protein